MYQAGRRRRRIAQPTASVGRCCPTGPWRLLEMHVTRSAEQIFHEARMLPSSERAGYLKGACGGDTALWARVEALLNADAQAGEFLRTSEEIQPGAPAESFTAT